MNQNPTNPTPDETPDEERYHPFSNGSEADIWTSNNCARCSRYRYESDDPDGCPHNIEIEMAWLDDGTIPERTANFIGTTERSSQDDGDHFCTLRTICRYRSDEANPPEINDYDQPGQLTLFPDQP